MAVNNISGREENFNEFLRKQEVFMGTWIDQRG
jgi:hypothetical protein